MTTPQNGKTTLFFQKNLICRNKRWFLWHKIPSLRNGKAEVVDRHRPSTRVCVVVDPFARLFLWMPPFKNTATAVACHWTSYSVKESYNSNYTSVSTEISINILENWMSVREKLPEEQKDEGSKVSCTQSTPGFHTNFILLAQYNKKRKKISPPKNRAQ